MLKPNLCDYNNAYMFVTQVTFKGCAPFIKCITKIDGPTIADAEDLDLVMLMYNR